MTYGFGNDIRNLVNFKNKSSVYNVSAAKECIFGTNVAH